MRTFKAVFMTNGLYRPGTQLFHGFVSVFIYYIRFFKGCPTAAIHSCISVEVAAITPRSIIKIYRMDQDTCDIYNFRIRSRRFDFTISYRDKSVLVRFRSHLSWFLSILNGAPLVRLQIEHFRGSKLIFYRINLKHWNWKYVHTIVYCQWFTVRFVKYTIYKSLNITMMIFFDLTTHIFIRGVQPGNIDEEHHPCPVIINYPRGGGLSSCANPGFARRWRKMAFLVPFPE